MEKRKYHSKINIWLVNEKKKKYINPSFSISDPLRLPVAPLFLMHFLPKFSIYVNLTRFDNFAATFDLCRT